MLRERSVLLTQELVRIKSVTFHELECAQYIAEHFRSLGFETEIDDANNVIAERKGTGDGKRMLYLGHHDVVEEGDVTLWKHPPYEAVIEDGLIYGRGTNDEKGGIASCIAAVEKFLVDYGSAIKGDIVFVSCREETSDIETRGIMKILERGMQADFCVCLEPSRMNIVLGHKGRAVIDIVTHGKTAHGSVPEKGINAVMHMAYLLLEIEKLQLPYSEPLGQGTHCVGTIRGGLRPNIVPERCEVSIDRRIVGGETIESIAEQFNEAIAATKQRVPELVAEFKIRPPFYPSFILESEPIVAVAKKAAEIVGYRPQVTYFQGHTDAEWVVNDLKIPSIILGPGDMDTAHSAKEVVEIDQLEQAAKMYYEIMKMELL